MTKSLKFSDNRGQNILAKTLFFCITQPASEKQPTSFNVVVCRLLSPHAQEQH